MKRLMECKTCGVLMYRHSLARFCHDCMEKRNRERNRGIIRREVIRDYMMEYYSKNRVKIRGQMRAYYHRTKNESIKH